LLLLPGIPECRIRSKTCPMLSNKIHNLKLDVPVENWVTSRSVCPQVVNVPGDEPVSMNTRKSRGPRIQRVQQLIDDVIWRSFTW
jgi:hypothetical protein